MHVNGPDNANTDTLWCLRLLSEVIAELIAFYFLNIHEDKSELY